MSPLELGIVIAGVLVLFGLSTYLLRRPECVDPAGHDWQRRPRSLAGTGWGVARCSRCGLEDLY